MSYYHFHYYIWEIHNIKIIMTRLCLALFMSGETLFTLVFLHCCQASNVWAAAKQGRMTFQMWCLIKDGEEQKCDILYLLEYI